MFGLALLVYALTSYAGIRSADSEVIFETCDSLLHRSTFRVQSESAWQGFGLADGTDGGAYAIFGPLEAIACVPFLAAAETVHRTRWFDHMTPARSHYIDGGIRAVLLETVPDASSPAREAHARRALVAWAFNTLVGATAVVTFLRVARRLARHRVSALLVTGAYGFASLAWPYSGTFFSEPLATLLVLLSFEAALVGLQSEDSQHIRPTKDGLPRHDRRRLLLGAAAGVTLALAIATHISALLFFPFWLALAARSRQPRTAALAAGGFLAGALPVLLLLAFFNHVRFGSMWETGRSLGAADFRYGAFQAPWRGLGGLIASPGKGLLLFCPVVVLGLFAWRRFAARSAATNFVALTVGAALLVRWLFLATRSDWHGGFSLGPRYLVPAIPFLLLPAVALVDELIDARQRRRLVAILVFVWACSLQQLFFVVGEIFSYLHLVKWNGTVAGRDVFKDDEIYLRWAYSPLLHLLQGLRGPFMLRAWPWGNVGLWAVCAVVVSAAWLGVGRLFLSHVQRLAPGEDGRDVAAS